MGIGLKDPFLQGQGRGATRAAAEGREAGQGPFHSWQSSGCTAGSCHDPPGGKIQEHLTLAPNVLHFIVFSKMGVTVFCLDFLFYFTFVKFLHMLNAILSVTH